MNLFDVRIRFGWSTSCCANKSLKFSQSVFLFLSYIVCRLVVIVRFNKQPIDCGAQLAFEGVGWRECPEVFLEKIFGGGGGNFAWGNVWGEEFSEGMFGENFPGG